MAIIDLPSTRLTVNGANVRSYDLDTTPVTPSDIGAYTTAQVDAAIAAAIANVQVIPGDSLWSIGNAENFTRLVAGGSVTATSGSVYLMYFTALKANTLTSLGFITTGTAGAGITACRMGIYTVASNGDMTLAARTASQTNVGTAQYSSYTMPLASAGGYSTSYTFTAGARYAFGFIIAATTVPTINAASPSNTYNLPKITSKVTGQSDLATSYSNATAGAHYEAPYFYGMA